MIFQRPSPKIALENNQVAVEENEMAGNSPRPDEIETVVGPSVNVEGDFASEGNITVKGSVTGSVRTSRHLLVEEGARISANVTAGSARIAGEVRGNIRVEESLELTATAKILGDIKARLLAIESGAVLFGKVTMPGVEEVKETKTNRFGRRVARKGDVFDGGGEEATAGEL